MPLSTVQIIMLAFSGMLIITGIYFIITKHRKKAKVVITFITAGTILFILVAIQSYTTKNISHNTMENVGYQYSQEHRNIIIEYFKNPFGNLTTEEKENLIADARNRPNEKRTPEDYLVLSTDAWQKEKYDESLALASAGLQLKQDSSRIQAALLACLGDTYHTLKRYDLAIQYYKKALYADDNFAAPHNSLGNIYTEQKRYTEAEQEYRKAIELNTKDIQASETMSVLCKAQNRNEDAKRAFKKSIMLDPKHSNAQYNLGLLYEIQGQKEEAQQAFEKALESYHNP